MALYKMWEALQHFNAILGRDFIYEVTGMLWLQSEGLLPF